MDIHWDIPPVRNQTLLAAFEHGVLARKTVVSEGTGALTLAQILRHPGSDQAAVLPIPAVVAAVRVTSHLVMRQINPSIARGM